MYPRNIKKHPSIAIAVIVSIIIIGASIWHVTASSPNDSGKTEIDADMNEKLKFVRSVQPDDHILGNPNAPIVFYVYSDFNCEYCKSYHKTLHALARTYAVDGTFAWVFRHIPFVQIHPESPMYALASECVAQETGDNGFWKFADDLYDKTDILEPLSASILVEMAENVGVDKQAFVACMKSNKLMDEVTKDFNEAIEAGAVGSPFTIIQTPDRRDIFQGAQDYRVLARALETYSRSLEVTDLKTPTEVSSMSDLESQFENFENPTTPPPGATVSTTSPDVNTSSAGSILDGIVEN